MQKTGKTEFDWLKDSVSDDDPCGPNLDTENDSEFIDYYFDAETRLPERYFTPGLKTEDGEGSNDKLFDPKSVDLKKERKSIVELLKRSRDLRLLSLLARFSILAGKIKDFADAIEGIAILLETHPGDAHPTIGKTATNRRMPLDELGTGVTVMFPLQYVALNGQADVTFRRYLVATGKAQARSGEEEVTLAQITDALADNDAKQAVTDVYDALWRAFGGLDRIKRVCNADPDAPFTPTISPTTDVLTEIMGVLEQARPELARKTDAPIPEEAQSKPETPANTSSESALQTPPSGEGAAPVPVPDPSAAKAVLQAVEQYFARQEPSSAAVLLVTQARLLIGRPLIEALETLLPEHSKNVVIDFGKETGFALSIDRLRILSSAIEASPAGGETQDSYPVPQIRSRLDVASRIRSVIDYYRQNEPASPIPILLLRASEYLEKDFNAIVAELLPASKPQ